ncbi:MAG: right-handed parallel beta-helix repeat-containing protein [Sedimentisphaerales bacterium]|nr:right-handed parallel beta-helix repeat-containing protein [Sedimentisphaerales bacterium]
MRARYEYPFSLIIIVLILSLAIPGTLGAITIYVDDDAVGDPCQTGSVSYPFAAIKDAVLAADPCDVVLVADGSYTGPDNCGIEVSIPITIESAGGPEVTIIDCQASLADAKRAFYFYGSASSGAILDGFTLENGLMYTGGAIVCDESASPTITNCIIRNCQAISLGGAIACISDSNPLITHCNIYGNSVEDYGGAIMAWASSPIIKNSIIAGNKSSYGGAIACLNQSETEIYNCTIVQNRADPVQGSGGGIYCAYDNTDVLITNSILWENTSAGIRNQYALSDDFVSLTISYTDIQPDMEVIIIVADDSMVVLGDGNIGSDPLFVSLGTWNVGGEWEVNGDYHVHVNSPVINSGDPAYLSDNVDIDGQPRVHGGRVDMGADETITIDIDGDGRVDLSDFAVISQEWLLTDVVSHADFDSDGDVNLADLVIFLESWFWPIPTI